MPKLTKHLRKFDYNTPLFTISVVLLIAASVVSAHASVTGYIDPADKLRFLEVLTGSLIIQPNDIVSPYYGATGFKLLEQSLVKVLRMDNCEHLKQNFKAGVSPEAAFYALSAWSSLECAGKLHTDEVIKVMRVTVDDNVFVCYRTMGLLCTTFERIIVFS